ncbi:protein S100-P [Fundulus heteroclitus]|uniref:protein S100-P n=1 Tax=Fundulus heteroclitus TaxID=8078 RepID=UPI00165B7365|nr:protein S100-P [Fundulus heteroclitus]
MSHLEIAMATLIQTFDKYAGADGKKATLSKAEVKTLMEKELPGLLKAEKNPEAVDKLMKSLDSNGDAEVDFQEFVFLVATLACTAHNRICKKN